MTQPPWLGAFSTIIGFRQKYVSFALPKRILICHHLSDDVHISHHHYVFYSLRQSHWHTFIKITQCAYCGEKGLGTMLRYPRGGLTAARGCLPYGALNHKKSVSVNTAASALMAYEIDLRSKGKFLVDWLAPLPLSLRYRPSRGAFSLVIICELKNERMPLLRLERDGPSLAWRQWSRRYGGARPPT